MCQQSFQQLPDARGERDGAEIRRSRQLAARLGDESHPGQPTAGRDVARAQRSCEEAGQDLGERVRSSPQQVGRDAIGARRLAGTELLQQKVDLRGPNGPSDRVAQVVRVVRVVRSHRQQVVR